MTMIDSQGQFLAFRGIGSVGLVIFERDGILIPQTARSSDLVLGDVNTETIGILRQLRKMDVRFGFVSDQSGMDAGTHGRLESAALMRILDVLLGSSGATPDFWIAWRELAENDVDMDGEQRQRKRIYARLITQVTESYGVDKTQTVLVSSSSASIVAAKQIGITGIHYSSWPVSMAGHSSTMTSVRLAPTIQQILALERPAGPSKSPRR